MIARMPTPTLRAGVSTARGDAFKIVVEIEKVGPFGEVRECAAR
jgi:hypothetical protein